MQNTQKQTADWLLKLLAETATRSEGTWDITLFVGGSTVSGEIVEQTEYLEDLCNYLEGFGTGADLLAEIGEGTKQRVAQAFPEAVERVSEYIHLRNVKINGEEATPLWRGRLDAVDGFSFG